MGTEFANPKKLESIWSSEIKMLVSAKLFGPTNVWGPGPHSLHLLCRPAPPPGSKKKKVTPRTIISIDLDSPPAPEKAPSLKQSKLVSVCPRT